LLQYVSSILDSDRPYSCHTYGGAEVWERGGGKCPSETIVGLEMPRM